MYVYLLLFTYTIILLSICTYFINYNKEEPYKYKTWYKPLNNGVKNRISNDLLEAHNINRIFDHDIEDDGKTWDIYIPNSSSTSKALNDIKIDHKHQIINLVSNNGALGNKRQLWINLGNYYGRDGASTIMPPSYVFPQDKDVFKKAFDKNKMYMMKAEKQRQEGLKLSNKYDEIVNSHKNKDKYVIVQEYIENPLAYNGYKLNFRVYLLVVCKNGWITSKDGYIYNDGIISYAKRSGRNDKNINFDNGVASFYTSKDLYDKGYPITLLDLEKVMQQIDWANIRRGFKKQTKMVFNAVKGHVGNYKFKCNNKSFQLFGIDFMVTHTTYGNNNGPKSYILEINVGPGMDPYTDRDDKMRTEMHKEMLSLVGIITDNNSNNFIKL